LRIIFIGFVPLREGKKCVSFMDKVPFFAPPEEGARGGYFNCLLCLVTLEVSKAEKGVMDPSFIIRTSSAFLLVNP